MNITENNRLKTSFFITVFLHIILFLFLRNFCVSKQIFMQPYSKQNDICINLERSFENSPANNMSHYSADALHRTEILRVAQNDARESYSEHTTRHPERRSLLRSEGSQFGDSRRLSDQGINKADVLSLYIKEIFQQIEANKNYPKIEKRRAHEGVVTIGFNVKRDGSLEDAVILKRCRYSRLNKSALLTVNGASPFNKIPKILKEDTLSVNIDIIYSLK